MGNTTYERTIRMVIMYPFLFVASSQSLSHTHAVASGTGCTLSMGEKKILQRLPWESSSCGSAGRLVGYTYKGHMIKTKGSF